MTLYNLTATQERATAGLVTGKGGANVPICLVATVELPAAASASTITFCQIPTKARILGASRIYFDDCATSGSPVLDLGLFPVDANITGQDDAFAEALAISSVSTANLGQQVVSDIALFGKKAWEFVSGVTADPTGQFVVKGTVKDAATTQTGTVTLELYYTLD
jgi:hypothetical protein